MTNHWDEEPQHGGRIDLSLSSPYAWLLIFIIILLILVIILK